MDLFDILYARKAGGGSGEGGGSSCNAFYIRFTGGDVTTEPRNMTDEEQAEMSKAEWAAGIWAEITFDGSTYCVPCGFTDTKIDGTAWLGFSGAFVMPFHDLGAIIARLLVGFDGTLRIDIPMSIPVTGIPD